ncbi:MAG TPA: YlxR family protein [Polyangia bacterium]
MAQPQRTCVGCRKTAPARELVRLVLIDGRLQPWRGRRPGGRGASIHGQAACVKAALKTGAFSRAFRARIEDLASLEPDSLLQLLIAATIRKTS